MKRCNGFTLIEALAATALAAIMMTAVMSVVTAIARSDKMEDRTPDQSDWRSRVSEVIRQDVRHAHTVESRDNRITFTGHVSLDRKRLNPTHRPAVVTYSVVQDTGQSWLFRTQTDTEDRSLHNSWSQAVCSGIRGISLTTQSTFNKLESTGRPEDGMAIVGPEESGEADNSGGKQLEAEPTKQILTEVPTVTATLVLVWEDPSVGESTTTLLIH
ncbi:MAG: prepilin-type N-terminal cleavage/methylation domain-containing protein [Phycisphaerales bacterium]